EARQSRDIRVGVARDNVNVPSVGVPDLAQAVQEGGRQGCKPGLRSGYQIAEYRARAPIGLLRARRERPRRRAAEQRDELASCKLRTHSITSSASCRNGSEILRPSALAVLRLTTSSNFVGCSTGKSAGLAPLRILST